MSQGWQRHPTMLNCERCRAGYFILRSGIPARFIPVVARTAKTFSGFKFYFLSTKSNQYGQIKELLELDCYRYDIRSCMSYVVRIEDVGKI
jgi:hypothetical protein